MLGTITEYEQSTGKTFLAGLVRIPANAERNIGRIAGYKILLEHLVAKESHTDLAMPGSGNGIAIMLPEPMPDLAERPK